MSLENDQFKHKKTLDNQNTHTFKLPNTRFQGSKKKMIDKIYELIVEQFQPDHILDLFGGSSICSLYFQLSNVHVTYNDLLQFNSLNAHGLLLTDPGLIPTEEEIGQIFERKEHLSYSNFIEETFQDIYYTDEENKQLDIFRENIKHVSDDNRRNIFYYLLFQSLLSKRPYNLFHRKNLSMRTAEVDRKFGNKATWDRPFIQHMLKFRTELFNLYQHKQLHSLGNTQILTYSYDDIPECVLSNIDTLYIDPPYFKKDTSDSQYFDYYHFLEGFISQDWESQIDFNTKNLKLKTTSKYIIESATNMFDQIIDKYHSKNLVISYNTQSFPSVSDIQEKLEHKYKRVITKYVDYTYALSKKKSQEVLILALVT